jgi:hypothetical protein
MKYLLLVLALLAGCSRKAEVKPAAEPAAAETLLQTSESGPVKVTVAVSPKAPRLGDPLTLTLTVVAQAQVAVEMPPFGEALGRFSITSFTPRSETQKDGSVTQVQRYVLEAPMSGRQRIPSLRIEFTDNRPGQAAHGDDGRPHEILTDEVAIDIASVLPEGDKASELRGLRGPLPLSESLLRTRGFRLVLIPAVLLVAALAYLGFRRLQRRSQLRVRASAYDVAAARLAELARRGWPQSEQVDPWYVELSDIVRRYIEDRYGVRAPELTTEEFLREARQQLRMQDRHRELLAAFLQTCDRVKFAGYRPAESESRQALEEARRYLEETRLHLSDRAAGAEARP